MMTIDENISAAKALLDTIQPGSHIPTSVVQQLQALHALRTIQLDLQEHEWSQQSKQQQTTIPEGFEIVYSGGRYGFRRKGSTRVIRWSSSLRSILSRVWSEARLVAVEDLDALDAQVITVDTLGITTPSPAMLQALILAAVSAFKEGTAPAAVLTEAIDLPSYAEAQAVIDHLVALGFLEVVGGPAGDESENDVTRSYRWMKAG